MHCFPRLCCFRVEFEPLIQGRFSGGVQGGGFFRASTHFGQFFTYTKSTPAHTNPNIRNKVKQTIAPRYPLGLGFQYLQILKRNYKKFKREIYKGPHDLIFPTTTSVTRPPSFSFLVELIKTNFGPFLRVLVRICLLVSKVCYVPNPFCAVFD